MAKDLYCFPILFTLFLVLILGCNQSKTKELPVEEKENTLNHSSLEYIYELASKKDLTCLNLTDSILRVTSDQNMRAESYYIKGLYYSNINDKPQAEKFFDSTILENYTFYDAYIEKGIILNQKGDFEGSLQTLQIALEITKNNPDLYYWMGKSFEGLNRKKEASNYYEMTLKIDPTYQSVEESLKRTKQ